jgi:hypothetical protein
MQVNLTTALIALAVLVLVGIALQGAWWSRRVSVRRPSAVPRAEEADARREPRWAATRRPRSSSTCQPRPAARAPTAGRPWCGARSGSIR